MAARVARIAKILFIRAATPFEFGFPPSAKSGDQSAPLRNATPTGLTRLCGCQLFDCEPIAAVSEIDSLSSTGRTVVKSPFATSWDVGPLIANKNSPKIA